MKDSDLYKAFQKLIIKSLEFESGEEEVKTTDSPTEEHTDTVTEDKMIVKSLRDEERISVEIVYEPYVLDEHEEWMSEETIAKACANFNDNLASGNLKPNLYHIVDEPDKLEILKSYVMPCDCIIGKTEVKKGTWVAEIKWHDPILWKKRSVPDENGDLEIAGVSIGAKGTKLIPSQGSDDVSE